MTQTPLDILMDRGIEHRQHGDRMSNAGHNWIQVDCPFCSPGSGKFRLGVHRAQGNWNCWLCGPKRSTEAWAAVLHVDPAKARQLTAKLPRHEIQAPEEHTGKLILPPGLGELLPPHIRYLIKRRVSKAEVDLWGIQGIGPEGQKLAWRLFLPLMFRGKMVSWVTRTIQPYGVRYIAAGEDRESMRGKSLLFGGDFVQHACVIHEGPMDAVATGPGAVALCGIGYTTAQVRLLSEIPRRIICFDNEPKAQERAEQLADMLAVYPGATHTATLDTGNDAGEADKKELVKLRAFAGI